MSILSAALSETETRGSTVGIRAVDTSRGALDGSLSRQWASRPHDQRFTSIQALADYTARKAQAYAAADISTQDILVDAAPDDADKLAVEVAGRTLKPTHWAFGQLAGLAGAPAGYLRDLPAVLAGANLQYGLSNNRETIRAHYDTETGEMRAATSTSYGRIANARVVRALQALTDNGNWKIPGTMDWGAGTYDPHTPVTVDSTTLFASDRDMFTFLVDDTRPIEVGKLANGDPDLMFRGVMVWNSEVGAATAGYAEMFLRAVCANRNLWGVEGRHEITIRHTANALTRWYRDVAPRMRAFTGESDNAVVAKIDAAKSHKIEAEKRFDWLVRHAALGKRQAVQVDATHLAEEGRPIETVWDAVQAITAHARQIPYQSDRVALETAGASLMAKVRA